MGPLAMLKLAIEDSLWQSLVWLSDYVPSPAKLGLHQDFEDAWETCLGQYHCIWHCVLPLYASDLTEACCMKVGKLSCMALIYSPSLTLI